MMGGVEVKCAGWSAHARVARATLRECETQARARRCGEWSGAETCKHTKRIERASPQANSNRPTITGRKNNAAPAQSEAASTQRHDGGQLKVRALLAAEIATGPPVRST